MKLDRKVHTDKAGDNSNADFFGGESGENNKNKHEAQEERVRERKSERARRRRESEALGSHGTTETAAEGKNLARIESRGAVSVQQSISSKRATF